MKDFTYKIYERLLTEIRAKGYKCISYEDYILGKDYLNKFVILRHDVDGKPYHSLKMARIQHRFKVKGTYYFRNVSQSFDEEIISAIARLDHEIGFHYEDLSQCKGNGLLAIQQFRRFLDRLRSFYPVRTICMHGSPLSKYDNRLIWNNYDYRDFGIIGEPYFDTDFDKVWYVTDTGRGWNNKSSIRDKVSNAFNIKVNNTKELIDLFGSDQLPDKIMINIHPQRWTNNWFEWWTELIIQQVKNILKTVLNRVRPQPTFNNREIQSA